MAFTISGRSSSLPLASSPPGCRDGARRGAEELARHGPKVSPERFADSHYQAKA